MPPTDCYHVFGETIGLRFPSEAVADLFRHVLGGFSSSSNCCSSSLPYDIEADDGRSAFRVTRAGTTVGRYPSLFELVSGLEREILSDGYRRLPGPGLHAGAVAHNGRTLLFPGGPGSGKTSLVLSLLLKGWTLLSDELAAVNHSTPQIEPFPRALWVKPDGLGLFSRIDSDSVLSRPNVARRVGDCTCVTPTAFPLAAEARPVSTIVFPTVSPGTEACLEALPKARALGLLMDQAFNRANLPDAGLGPLGDLVESAECYSLTSGSLEGSLDCVLEASCPK